MLLWLMATSALAAEPRWQASAEGGWQILAGSNAKAFEAGPVARAGFTFQDAGTYATELSYTFASHDLDDPASLYEDPLDTVRVSGGAELHSLMFGARLYPAATDASHGVFRGGLQPWFGSNAGLTMSVGHLTVAGSTSSTVRVKLVIDGAAGLDIPLGKSVLISVAARAAVLPGFRPAVDEDDSPRVEALWMLNPGLGIGIRF